MQPISIAWGWGSPAVSATSFTLKASGVKGWVANGGDSSLDGSHSPCPTCGCVLGHVEAWYYSYCEIIVVSCFF